MQSIISLNFSDLNILPYLEQLNLLHCVCECDCVFIPPNTLAHTLVHLRLSE